jgi:hypothetical protein
MPNNNSLRALAAFFTLLEKNQPTEKAAGLFLAALGGLPGDLRREMPVLTDLARLRGGAAEPGAAARGGEAAEGGLIRRRLERRYQRICFVQDELGKLDFKKAKAGENLENFVFNQIDFSIYKKIREEDFTLLFSGGLEDFADSFFAGAFNRDRAAVRGILEKFYRKIGSFYYIRQENPLILSVMRTLHSSLEFVPLFSAEEALGECAALVRFLEARGLTGQGASRYLDRGLAAFFPCLLRALEGIGVRHGDGMQTELAITGEPLTLRGVFHPRGKAYTIPLVITN